MPATLVFPEHARWYAPLQWYQQLASKLPDGWIVNAGGEVVNRDPMAIADHVLAGGVWVDYCGYPMYYREDPYPPTELPPTPWETTLLTTQGTLGFSRFLTRMNLLFDHTFMSEGFTYPRSLVVQERSIPSFITSNKQSPHTEKTFSSFALKHPSGGMYLYAYASPKGEGVNPDVYSTFALSLLGQGETPPLEPPAEIPEWVFPVLILAAGGTAIYLATRR